MIKVPILPAIVTGNSPSGFVCIQDSLEQSGRSILQAFAQNAINRQCNIHVICNEHPLTNLKNKLQHNESTNVHFHDSFSDPIGWMKDPDTENVSESSTDEMSITSILENDPKRNRGPYIIILESLTPYVFNFGFPKCYREFSKLLTSGIKGVEVSWIICLVHEDSLPSADICLPQLAHLATAYITVKPSTTPKKAAVANIVLKKPGGKVIKQMEEYTICDNNRITSQIVKVNELVAQKSRDNAKDLPNDLTTFKLSLGQQEKEARSQLVLPYIRKEENSKEESKGGGNVYYQPDAADDWDEEDPDDDLDI